MNDRISSVGVIDKSMAVLDAVAGGSTTLVELVEHTGLNRATVHRLAVALTEHGMLRRDGDGRFLLGYRLWSLGQQVAGAADLASMSQPFLDNLRDLTGESAQLFVQDGAERLCIAAAESGHGLRTIVPVGTRLPLDLGSGGAALQGAVSTDGWVASVAEREAGVASVSSPVRSASGEVVAAVSVSGPIDRLSTDPGGRHGLDVVDAANKLAQQLSR